MKKLLFTFLVLLPFITVQANEMTVKAEKKSIKDIIEKSCAHKDNGKSYTVKGAFKGWGKCEESDMKTRSDWVIQEKNSCIYVSGKVPKGLNASKPNDESVEITGTLKFGKNYKPYLEIK